MRQNQKPVLANMDSLTKHENSDIFRPSLIIRLHSAGHIRMKLPSILNLKMLSGAGLNSQINEVQVDAL